MRGTSLTPKQRLTLLQRAKSTGSVSDACAEYGISRTIFYRLQKRYDEQGPAGLHDLPPVAKNHPRKTPEDLASLVAATALKHPASGCRDVAERLARRGRELSAVTVQKLLRSEALGTQRERWLDLERRLFLEKAKLSEEQLQFLAHWNPNIADRHLKRSHPGETLCAGMFNVWSIAHQRPVCVIAVADPFSGFVHATADFAKHHPHPVEPVIEAIAFYAGLGFLPETLMYTADSVIGEMSNLAPLLAQHLIEEKPVKTQIFGFIERFRRELLKAGRTPLKSLERGRRRKHSTEDAFSEWMEQYNLSCKDGFPYFGKRSLEMLLDCCEQWSLTNIHPFTEHR